MQGGRRRAAALVLTLRLGANDCLFTVLDRQNAVADAKPIEPER
jgi:hypothetical protein